MNVPITQMTVGLLPVGVFLVGLVYLDSYKLVTLRATLIAIGAGCAAAIVALVANTTILDSTDIHPSTFSRYVAPVLEECLKAVYLVYLLHRKRIGFMVDAAICGFAIGAGFSMVENLYYLQTVDTGNLLVWIIRGFGTALMHGGTTAVVGVLGRSLQDRFPDRLAVFPGLAVAVFIHSLFNHFFLSPVISTLLTLCGLPFVMYLVFRYSEQSTREWLGVGFDTDQALLQMLTTGVLLENKVGQYLASLQDRFPGEVVADLLCLLRIHVELSINAKGLLLMREAGFEPGPDPQVQAKLKELKFLHRSVGKTGLLALHPFMHTSSRSLWELHMLSQT